MRNRSKIHLALTAIVALTALPTTAKAEPVDTTKMQEWYQWVTDKGLIEGVREVEIIRPDIVRFTVDPALTRCLIPEPGAIREFQDPGLFTITSTTDNNYASAVHPTKVGVQSYIRFNRITEFPPHKLHWHTYYLYLEKPLVSGNAYTVAMEGVDPGFAGSGTLVYDEKITTTRAIKINQCGYSSFGTQRYAYLGWWAGDQGPVDYSDYATFEVIDRGTGKTALTGEIELRALNDTAFSGEDVYEMDITALGPGNYHIHIPGLACSDSFVVGIEGVQQTYYHTMRAFLHQRCGQELREPWTWVQKPACHTEVWESGHLVDGPGKDMGVYDPDPYTPTAGEQKRSFRGGYHDAADFDIFTYHIPAMVQFMIAYDMNPPAFRDGDLNIPESGNGIPDILDEAVWGLSWWMLNQNDDGSVPMGQGNECDAFKQQTGGELPAYGILPVRRIGVSKFAAGAALLARLIEPFDAETATRHLEAAKKAYGWAMVNEGDPTGLEPDDVEKDNTAYKKYLSWAATELYFITGNKAYHDYFMECATGPDRYDGVCNWQHKDIRYYSYLTCDDQPVDTAMRAWMLDNIADRTRESVDNTQQAVYRNVSGNFESGGWGNRQGVHAATHSVVLYAATGDPTYLNTVSLNADWHLGCNPAGRTFLTNMGYRYPYRPEISWFLYGRNQGVVAGPTVKGIPIYGIGPRLKNDVPPVPAARSWKDQWGWFAEVWNEFTVGQCLGPAAMVYATLYAMEADKYGVPSDPLAAGEAGGTDERSAVTAITAASNRITVQVAPGARCSAVIFDVNGRVRARHSRRRGGTMVLNTGRGAAGMTLLRVQTDRGTVTRRLLTAK